MVTKSTTSSANRVLSRVAMSLFVTSCIIAIHTSGSFADSSKPEKTFELFANDSGCKILAVSTDTLRVEKNVVLTISKECQLIAPKLISDDNIHPLTVFNSFPSIGYIVPETVIQSFDSSSEIATDKNAESKLSVNLSELQEFLAKK